MHKPQLPLTEEQQEELISLLEQSQQRVRKQERKIKRLERDMDVINTIYENEIKMRDFHEKEKEKQYLFNNLLLQNFTIMLFVLDKDLNYVIGTEKLICDAFDYHKNSQLSGEHLYNILNNKLEESYVVNIVTNCVTVLIENNRVEYNESIHYKNKKQHLNISISPVKGTEDTVDGILLMMHDITQLVEMKERAEAASNSKSNFLANMSHEIRTPMNAILGLSSLLETCVLDDIQKNYVVNIKKASESLLTIIDDILDFSKIDAQKFEIINNNYNVMVLLSDVFNIIHLKIEEKNLDFIINMNPDLPSVVFGDELRIKQVLVNLLNNAVKYTHKGYIEFHTDMEINGDICELIFTIKDSGIGIKEPDLENIFVAFEQVDMQKNRNIQGTGLGLAICHGLVTEMNGSISVQSKYGEGSVFVVRIPQKIINMSTVLNKKELTSKKVLFVGNTVKARAAYQTLKMLKVNCDLIENIPEKMDTAYTHIIFWDKFNEEDIYNAYIQHTKAKYGMIVFGDVGEQLKNIHKLLSPVHITDVVAFFRPDDNPLNSEFTAHDDTYFKTKGVNVLLVDDNIINLMVAKEILKQYDINVTDVDSGYKAIDTLKNNNYDIVFMDHMMPGMDGLETTLKIRNMGKRYEDVTIVALTANAIKGTREMFLENKFNDYLSKPIIISELNRILRKWLPKSKIV